MIRNTLWNLMKGFWSIIRRRDRVSTEASLNELTQKYSAGFYGQWGERVCTWNTSNHPERGFIDRLTEPQSHPSQTPNIQWHNLPNISRFTDSTDHQEEPIQENVSNEPLPIDQEKLKLSDQAQRFTGKRIDENTVRTTKYGFRIFAQFVLTLVTGTETNS